MFQWIVSSSVLIVLFVILRFLFKNRISARFQYALWLIVLIRLLVPFNLFSSSLSLNNLFFESGTQYSYYFASDLPEYTGEIDYSSYQTAPDFVNNILKRRCKKTFVFLHLRLRG